MKLRTDNRQRLCEEDWESQHKAWRFSPATVAKWTSKHGKHEWTLACGSSDEVYFFRSPTSPYVYCLSVNRRLGYAGLQAYDESTNEETHAVSEDHTPGLLDLAPINLAKHFAQWCYA